MKKIIQLTLFLLLTAAAGKAQTTVEYTYDNAGNRTLRHVVVLATKSAKADTSILAQQNKQKPVEEINGNQKITVYPNPTKGQLKVELQGYDLSQASSLVIVNLNGQVVVTKQKLTEATEADLSRYPAGNYFMKITVGSRISEWKIIKE